MTTTPDTKYYVTYRNSEDDPTSTCIAVAACEADVRAHFGAKYYEIVSVTDFDSAPSRLEEDGFYGIVKCPPADVPEHASSLDDVMASAIATCLTSQRLQEVVEERIAEAVADWVGAAFAGYNNPLRKAFEERVQELVIPAIERITLDNARLDVLLDTLVRQHGIGERAQILEGFGKLVMPEVSDEVKVSDIFDAWCTWVSHSYDCEGRQVEFDSTPYYAPIDCTCERIEHEQYSWSSMRRATATLLVSDDDNTDEAERFNRSVELWRWDDYPKDPALWYVKFPLRPTLKDLRTACDFDLLLARLDAHGAMIRWDLDDYASAEVAPEQEPEADYH